MKVSEFYYDLPKELIAQKPLKNRTDSRMMVVDRVKETINNKKFSDILNYLKKGDVLVINNSKVIPARIFGTKEGTGAKIEVLLLKELKKDQWECLIGNAKAVKLNTKINFRDDFSAICKEVKTDGIRVLEFSYEGVFLQTLAKIGHTPLPPYIKETLKNDSKYQTVYAKKDGSSAAPTAGLHFSKKIIKKVKEKGVEIIEITLHIGLDTFKPLKVENIKEHKMHKESFEISEENAIKLNKAKEEKRRIIAVGTTTTRALETNINKYGKFTATKEESDIFIYPGYNFKAIDVLITNFHLPKSTLLMMISAFAKKDLIFNAYKEAIKEKYRFFSFGDAMLIL